MTDQFTTKLFGAVALEDDGAYVTHEADAKGRTTRPALFVGEGLSAAQLKKAAELIDRVSTLEPEARKAIAADLADADGVTAAFIAFHVDELDAETVTAIFGAKPTPTAALSSLQLVGIGVHDDDGDVTLNLDFSFGKQHTDELLVVRFDPEGAISGVSHES